jgi:hypothetical protein
MAGPIYMFSTGRMTEAWHQLSKEEQESLWAKVRANAEAAGAKYIVLCDSRWSSEWPFFLLTEYPDLESVQRNFALDRELNWFRYVEGDVILGTKREGAS